MHTTYIPVVCTQHTYRLFAWQTKYHMPLNGQATNTAKGYVRKPNTARAMYANRFAVLLRDSASDRAFSSVALAFFAQKCAMLCEGSAYFGTEYTNEVRRGTADKTRGRAECGGGD